MLEFPKISLHQNKLYTNTYSKQSEFDSRSIRQWVLSIDEKKSPYVFLKLETNLIVKSSYMQGKKEIPYFLEDRAEISVEKIKIFGT